MTKIRYYNENVGPDATNEKSALGCAITISKSTVAVQEIALLVHTKHQVEYFNRMFGRSMGKRLFNGIQFDAGGIAIKGYTKLTFDDFGPDRVLVAMGLRSAELFEYDTFRTIKAIVAHPFVEDDVTDWAKTWGAINTKTDKPSAIFPLPNPIVIKALDSLTRRANLGNGFVHPIDETDAKTYVSALIEYNLTLDENEITAYLVREKNWDFRALEKFLTWVRAVNSGSKLKGVDKSKFRDYIEHWKKG